MAPRMINVSIGRLIPTDRNLGLPVTCYACDARHKAIGVAHVNDEQGDTYVPLCEKCLRTPDVTHNRVIRKFCKAPNLKITKGGKLGTG